jgi:hypothetical protein
MLKLVLVERYLQRSMRTLMTEADPHLKFVIILPQPCCENRIKNEDPSHTVAGMNSCLLMTFFETHLPPTSGHTSNYKRSADIRSLDDPRIKSLRPSISRGRMGDA